ncbi:MAG: putative serine/threonine protein kinase [Streblomastix strix]|uniref:Putative serine/threonine protein kinase n=1 Tax=Streblomastix strix TaxID=222440 RepID=A0A5J4WGP2_9EUKA|nr:MAG: putative serine/threonine protein kinase [Streblomastix strix]
MTEYLCINPECLNPRNSSSNKKCVSCGTKLQLNSRFYALKLLGKGAFGRTFVALDQKMQQKDQFKFVVIKMFFTQFESQQAIDLFRGEAKQLRALHHDCIPKFVDYFEQEGKQFIVQELIQGETITQKMMKLGCCKEDEIISFLYEIIPVIEYVHEKGVIHRDIKPDNIMKRTKDAKYILVDFGASFWKPMNENKQQLWKDGRSTSTSQSPSSSSDNMQDTDIYDENTPAEPIVGTPGFISPEVMRGERNKKCDYYSLGVTCIYMLTGVNPISIRGGVQNWKERTNTRAMRASAELKEMIDGMVALDVRRRHLPELPQLVERTRVAPLSELPVDDETWMLQRR